MYQRGLPWLEDIVRDVHYGLRALRRSPVLSLATILTFALGIGINGGRATAGCHRAGRHVGDGAAGGVL
jgi:hypothetical protein